MFLIICKEQSYLGLYLVKFFFLVLHIVSAKGFSSVLATLNTIYIKIITNVNLFKIINVSHNFLFSIVLYLSARLSKSKD